MMYVSLCKINMFRVLIYINPSCALKQQRFATASISSLESKVIVRSIMWGDFPVAPLGDHSMQAGEEEAKNEICMVPKPWKPNYLQGASASEPAL